MKYDGVSVPAIVERVPVDAKVGIGNLVFSAEDAALFQAAMPLNDSKVAQDGNGGFSGARRPRIEVCRWWAISDSGNTQVPRVDIPAGLNN